MCPSGATCLLTDCCFSELALWKSSKACWPSTKQTSSSFHWKLTCSRHDIQYTQGHIVVDHLQRRTACHVWLGVYRCLLIAHLLCEYLIVAKLGVVNLYLKVIKLWLTCTCSCIYLITHYNFNSIILDK